jgi:TRAP-type C4-dicarboxylate transport system substrate-binding protein
MTSKPWKSLADLKGMELRVSGTGADVIKRLGAIPIAMPMSDTPEAIQKGIVKGIVSSLETLQDFNYAAYCPYATEANLFVVSFAVVMNKAKWESLPADVKKVIDDLRREQAEWTGDYVDRHVKESLAWSKTKYNHQVFQLSGKDRAEITRLVQPMLDEYAKRVEAQGIPGKKIVGDVQQLKKKYEKKYK